MTSIKACLAGATAMALMAGSAYAGSHSVTACLITKTDTNPFFVKMKEGATAKAEELGMTPKRPATYPAVRKSSSNLGAP